MPGDYPNLEPVLTRPINWDLIIQQYDEMIKYAAAMKKGAADPTLEDSAWICCVSGEPTLSNGLA